MISGCSWMSTLLSILILLDLSRLPFFIPPFIFPPHSLLIHSSYIPINSSTSTSPFTIHLTRSLPTQIWFIYTVLNNKEE